MNKDRIILNPMQCKISNNQESHPNSLHLVLDATGALKNTLPPSSRNNILASF